MAQVSTQQRMELEYAILDLATEDAYALCEVAEAWPRDVAAVVITDLAARGLLVVAPWRALAHSAPGALDEHTAAGAYRADELVELFGRDWRRRGSEGDDRPAFLASKAGVDYYQRLVRSGPRLNRVPPD